MTPLHKYGLAFHVDAELDNGVQKHLIKSALVSERLLPNHSHSSWSSHFVYTLPHLSHTGRQRAGAAETLGIYGGMPDEAQRTLSEVVERNIGDVMVSTLTQFVLEVGVPHFRSGKHLLIVLGYPLPKVIGRFASLRLPRTLQVAWLYCFPPPAWLAIFPGWQVVSKARRFESRVCGEDELVVQEKCVRDETEYWVSWMNQYVSYESVHATSIMDDVLHELAQAPWIDRTSRLPSVLSVASLKAVGARLDTLEGRPGTIPHLLAAAKVEWSDSQERERRLRNNIQRVEQAISQHPEELKQLVSAGRGVRELSTEDLPCLLKCWNYAFEEQRTASRQ